MRQGIFALQAVRGVIDRRMLLNFRVDPEVLARLLPPPFRPKLAGGFGMAGICLIRLRGIKPRGVPWLPGLSSENAAHRIAVEWDERGERREGVYIPRRDTSSWLNRIAGGRVFPGEHHAARFLVEERDGRHALAMASRDGQVHVRVAAREAALLSGSSVFGSVEEASAFFERGALGWSATGRPGVFEGLELRSFSWRVEPLAVDEAASSFFSDPLLFPPGTVEFDCALLMRGIRHEWLARGRMIREEAA